MAKEKAKSIYLSDAQDEILEKHKKENNLTTARQIRMMINFVFRSPSNIKKFNDFIEQRSKEI